jgi:putative membrane protein
MQPLMSIIANIAVFSVALLQLSFMALEMFLWNKPAGLKIHRLKPDFADKTRKLAANQGLYNGFLAAGLLWSLQTEQFSLNLQFFFLGCVIIAGVFGAITTNRLILWIQALPAMIALVLVFLAQST